MLVRVLISALLAGAISGLFLSAVQWAGPIPLIYEAEVYEHRAELSGPPEASSGEAGIGREAHDEAGSQPAAGFERIGATVLADLLAGFGFALLVNAAFALRGQADFRRGLLFGLGGFAAFTLAPSLGLPPELPGAAAAALGERQLWWLLAAGLTAGGLALGAFGPRAHWKLAGLALIAAPHLIGAPEAPAAGGLAPEALERSFAFWVLVISAAFWLLLGGLSGLFFRRLG